jgi:exodeoxyribonuclease-5
MAGQGTEDREGLMPHIEAAARTYPHIRWIFMGDPYQLPPVGEVMSPVWGIPKFVELTKIMRQDNQILTLSMHLREMVQKPFGRLRLLNDNDGEEGVWALAGGQMDKAILNHADSFVKGQSKAIAWRNVEVDRLNRLIRQELFADSLLYPWQVDDRITLLGPVKDLDGEIQGTTDEDGAIEHVSQANHPDYDLPCYRLVMRSDLNSSMTLWVLHPSAKGPFENRKARLAAEAKANPKNWGAFWDFLDAFHPVRHAYAITAHRAQGSTYHRAFVSWRDILLNQSRGEAMRCLYVAATRPKKELYLG